FHPPAQVHEAWRRFVEGMGFPPELAGPLLDPDRVLAFCEQIPMIGLARLAQASTHTTLAPTLMEAGTKINVIPDRVKLQVDIRTLPGWDLADVRAMLTEAIGDLDDQVEIDLPCHDQASFSPVDTPLWDALQRVTDHYYPGARNVPFLTAGATDAR
ncbi:peptidase, partial [mine drainage metagenome]